MTVVRRLGAAVETLPRTRFAGWPPLGAALVLAMLAAVIGYGLILSVRSAPAPANVAVTSADAPTDTKLYKRIASRVAGGEDYYAAAVGQQRAEHYPVRPVFTVRLPTLAMVQAHLGEMGAYLVLCVLTLAAALAWMVRLRSELRPGRASLYASVLCVVGLMPTLAPVVVYWHESWAAVLIALSLAVRTREKWLLAVVFGLTAVAIRELALPYLCLMAVTAAWQRNFREASIWVGAILAFVVGYALHAHTVTTLVTATDLASPGWRAAGGWAFILRMMHTDTILAAANLAITAVVVPLSFLGWAAWRTDVGLRTVLLLVGYAGFFMLFGRPDNDYWGLLVGPLLFIGLAFVPGALRDLAESVLDVHRIAPRASSPVADGGGGPREAWWRGCLRRDPSTFKQNVWRQTGRSEAKAAPSTVLRTVPLPRFAGEDAPGASQRWPTGVSPSTSLRASSCICARAPSSV